MAQLTRCARCGLRWTSSQDCHCGACCGHFASLEAFSAHFPHASQGRCEPMAQHVRRGFWRPPWSKKPLEYDRTSRPPKWRRARLREVIEA